MIKSAFRWRCTVEIASQTSLRLTWGGYSAIASYMVQVEHSDGTEMLVLFFLHRGGAVYFRKALKGRRVDSAWRSLPVEEVGSLIAMLNKDE